MTYRARRELAGDAPRFGVTTALDMFTIQTSWLAAARSQRESLEASRFADVWSAGIGVTVPGGHPQGSPKTLKADGDVAAAIDIPVAATLSVISNLGCGPHAQALIDDDRLAPLLTSGQIDNLSKTSPRCDPDHLENAIHNVRVLHEAGLPMLAGPDAPNPGTAYGPSMLGEVGLLTEAGLSPQEALTAATATPAGVFGLDDRGRIAGGYRADLVLVDGDPTENVDAIFDMVAIWKNGHPIDRTVTS